MEPKPGTSEGIQGITEKQRKCARLITLIGTYDDSDKGAILTSFKKNAKSKFVVLSPESLIESAKKKPEWGDELKKLQGKQTIEQTLQQSPQFRDILLRLVISKVEELDPKVVKEEPAKKETAKKAKKKKDEPGDGKKEEPAKEAEPVESAEKKTPTGSTKNKKPLVMEEYPADGPDNYVFITTECIRSLEDIKILRDKGVSFDIVANLKRVVEQPMPKSTSQINIASSSQIPRSVSAANIPVYSLMRDIKVVMDGGTVGNSTLELKHLSDSVWMDVIVDETQLPQPSKEVKDIYAPVFEDLTKKVFEMVALKNKYQEHQDAIVKVNFPLPVVDKPVKVVPPASLAVPLSTKQPSLYEPIRETIKEPSLPHISTYKQYNRLMNGIPEEAISISLVLNSIIEEVSYTGEKTISPEEEFQKKVQQMEEYFMKSFNRATLHTPENREDQNHVISPSMQLYSEDDRIGIRTLDHKDVNGESIQSIERAFHQRNVKVPTFGKSAVTETEDEIEDLRIERAEFLTFSSFHRTKVEQCFLLFEAEDMINEHMKGNEDDTKVRDEERVDVSFMDRDFIEEFNKETLVQVLDRALRTKPEVVSEYYPYEDGLLLAIYTKVPFTRITNASRWSPVNSTKNLLFNTGFGKWHKVNSSLQKSISSVSLSRVGSSIDLSSHKLEKPLLYDLDEASVNFTEENYVLFPSNGSYISLTAKRYPSPGPSSVKKDVASIKASVYTSGEVVFGISSVHASDGGNNGRTLLCNFTANFDDGLTVWCGRENAPLTTESKLPPISVTCSLANGLVVSHSFTESTITQLYLNGITNRSNSSSKAEALRLATFHAVQMFNTASSSFSSRELSRTLLLGKTVSIVRQFDDGSKEILFANGNTSVYQPEVGWTITNTRGSRVLKKLNGEEIIISPIGVAVKTNCETGELVINRQDMVRISRAKNNSRLSVSGPDGTSITTLTTGAGITVEINSPDFATTVVDISPSFVATSRTFLPNGSVIAFNTKSCEITSLSKVGPISILADEKSFVILREPTAGEYSFDCQSGAIEMSDSRNNNYRISPNGVPTVTLSQTEKRLIRVQSLVDEDEDIDYLQYITHPPRLFLLKRDGSGIEFVRSKDALTYIQSRQKEASGNYKLDERFVSATKEVQLLIEESENADSPKVYTVLTKSKYSRGELIAFRQLVHRPLISKEQQDVLLDELERFEEMKQEKPSKNQISTEEDLNAFQVSQEKIEELLKTRTFQAIPVEVKVLENIQNEESKARLREAQEQEEEEQRKLEELERKKQTPQKVINKERREQLTREAERAKTEKPISKKNYFEFEDGLQFLNSKQAVMPVKTTPPSSVSPNTINKEKVTVKELSPPTTPKYNSYAKSPAPVSEARKPSTASSAVENRQAASAPATYQRSQSHPTTPANKKFDVYGNDRSQPPLLPLPFLQSPGEPNLANQADASVKRKVQTSSTKMMEYSQLFALFPTKVDFGTVKQGNSYKTHLSLTNVGFDTGRFKVQAPPNLKVNFLKGPVAPGITAKIDVEISPQEVGRFEYELDISTEAEVFKVPIAVQVSSDSEAVAKGVSKVTKTSAK